MKKQKVIISVSIAIILLCLLYFFVPEIFGLFLGLLFFGVLLGSFSGTCVFLVSFFTDLCIRLFSKDKNRIDKAKKEFVKNFICFLLWCLLFCFCVWLFFYIALHSISV